MPLPRLGCGGPTQKKSPSDPAKVDVAQMHSDPEAVAITSHSEPVAASHAALRWGPIRIEDDASETTHEMTAASISGTHVPLTLFQAMPLPRLGCGGPSPMCAEDKGQGVQMTEPAGSQASGNDSESQNVHCRSDPYECSDEEPIPISEKHPLPFHLEDCPGQPNVSKPLPEQAQHVGHDAFFYEDPVFDQQVIAELEHPTTTFQETPFFQAGAVPGFAVKRKQAMPTESIKYHKSGVNQVEPEKAEIANALSDGTKSIRDTQIEPICTNDQESVPPEDHDESESHSPHDDHLQHVQQVHPGATLVPSEADNLGASEPLTVHVVEPGESFFITQVPPGSKIAQLIEATNKDFGKKNFARMTTIFGTPLASDALIQHKGWYMLCDHDINHAAYEEPTGSRTPCLVGKTRRQLLWAQEGWVSMDEMEYYLYMLECYKPGTMYGVLQLHDRPDQHTALTEYVLKVATEAGSDPEGNAKAFVIFTGDHWVPVVIRVQGIMIHLWTTPEDLTWMRPLIESTVGAKAFQFATSVMPSAFKADCGFQAVGWILSILLDDSTNVPFSEEQAAQWRGLFSIDLQNTGSAESVVTVPLLLGGMQGQREQLQKLVVERCPQPKPRVCRTAPHCTGQPNRPTDPGITQSLG